MKRLYYIDKEFAVYNESYGGYITVSATADIEVDITPDQLTDNLGEPGTPGESDFTLRNLEYKASLEEDDQYLLPTDDLTRIVKSHIEEHPELWAT